MAIKIKGSSTAGAVPASLENRQLAVNTTDKKLFVGDGTAVQTLTGTIASQDANNVNITGGTISGTNITNLLPVSSNVSYQEFTSSGTWTKPGNASFVLVECWGGGGGGTSGQAIGTSLPNFANGGSGGGGSAKTWLMFPAALLPSTVSVTIGAGGTGGVSPAPNGSNQSQVSGTNGGTTTFGSYLLCVGGFANGNGSSVSNDGINPTPVLNSAYGIGGSATQIVPPPYSGSGGEFGGGSGGGLNYQGPYSGGGSIWGSAGGASGGAINNSTIQSGGTGGLPGNANGASYLNGGGGAAGGSSGNNGTNGQQQIWGSGGGGGGGGASSTAAGGNGGNGGTGGGGGGGGGATLRTYRSGSGGNGGNGCCRVYTW